MPTSDDIKHAIARCERYARYCGDICEYDEARRWQQQARVWQERLARAFEAGDR